MEIKNKTISILGCGWLGVPLANHFLEKGSTVKGSVTSEEKFGLLKDEGILPFRLVLSDTEVILDDPDFFNCYVLIISIPPRRIEGIEQVFPSQIRRLIPFILKSGIQKVIFISSTSVYPDQNQLARENEILVPDKASGRALVEAENLLREQSGFKTTIIRFGGLIGADRNPARFLLKSTQPIANAPVNLIHQDDCIGIISAIIKQELWGETLNACCPEHPMKKDFYEKAAIQSGLAVPVISEELSAYKTIDSSKLIRLLNYQFIYSSPMDYLDRLETRHK
ncbi:MAG: SDR family NAD(P)-dependent oxidoreductase [Bacteroidota bacterium]|nr:SDR family NAD(P)-dependent oxidoreductase [Bacteroidota bacterium]